MVFVSMVFEATVWLDGYEKTESGFLNSDGRVGVRDRVKIFIVITLICGINTPSYFHHWITWCSKHHL